MYKDLFAAVFRLLFDENRESVAYLLFFDIVSHVPTAGGYYFCFLLKTEKSE